MTSLLSLRGLIGKKHPNIGSEQFETLLNSLEVAALVTSTYGFRIILANPKLSELSAYTRAELSTMNIDQLLASQGGSHSASQLLIESADQADVAELDLIMRGGNHLVVTIKATPLGGTDDLIFVTIEPSSLQKYRQVQIERQHQQWSCLADLTSFMLNPDMNAALCATLEASIDLTGASTLAVYQAEGQIPSLKKYVQAGDAGSLPDQITPNDLIILNKPTLWTKGSRAITQLHRQARAGNFSYLASIPLGEVDATIGLVLAAGHNLPPPDNLVEILQFLAIYLFTIIRGHTLFTNLNINLLEHKSNAAFNSALYENVEDGVIILTPDLTIQSLNPAAEQNLGYTTSEVLHQAIEKVLISTLNYEEALRTAQENHAQYLGDVKLFRRSGKSFLASLRFIPITLEGRLEGLVIMFHDLSEQEEYRIQSQQLEQRALLGEVTASFAHEVRNPINNISTGLQLLALNLSQDDPNQDNIRRLQADCERLADLVKSSLSFVRPMEYHLEPVDVSQVIKNLLERWHSKFERGKIKYQLQIEKNLPLVNGDFRALEQIFTNLINNAFQAMEGDGGLLSIKLKHIIEGEERSQVQIDITDTGPGIPVDIREHIFEPFFTTKQHGTGLGLAIVKRIITAHKGSIFVTSVPGGSVFHVRLPTAG